MNISPLTIGMIWFEIYYVLKRIVHPSLSLFSLLLSSPFDLFLFLIWQGHAPIKLVIVIAQPLPFHTCLLYPSFSFFLPLFMLAENRLQTTISHRTIFQNSKSLHFRTEQKFPKSLQTNLKCINFSIIEKKFCSKREIDNGNIKILNESQMNISGRGGRILL